MSTRSLCQNQSFDCNMNTQAVFKSIKLHKTWFNFIYLQCNKSELKKTLFSFCFHHILMWISNQWAVSLLEVRHWQQHDKSGFCLYIVVWYSKNQRRKQLLSSPASINIPILKWKPFTKNRFVQQLYFVEVCIVNLLFNMKSFLFAGYQFSWFSWVTWSRKLRIQRTMKLGKSITLIYSHILCSRDLDFLDQLHKVQLTFLMSI